MATIKNGILGGFTGKVGSVVGYRTYGEDRMRSISDRTAPATVGELKNRKQFKLVQDTLNCIKTLIKIGFKDYWTKTGGTRGAISYNKTRALQVTEDDCFIDPERFKFSGGVLPAVNNVTVELERPDLLRFNWNPELAYQASPKDQVMLLAIDLEGKKASYESLGNFRNSGTDVLNLSNDLMGKEVDIYIAVVAKDRSKQSDSQYLGRMTIPASNHVELASKEEKDHIIHSTPKPDNATVIPALKGKLPEAFDKMPQKQAETGSPKIPITAVCENREPMNYNRPGFTEREEQHVSSDIKISGDREGSPIDDPLFS